MEKQPESEPVARDNSYWADKGQPKDRLEVAFGDRRIEISNYSDIKLSADQLKELEKVIAEFSQINNGVALEELKSVFIDNEQPVDPEHKDGLNGMGIENNDGIIKLYPRALKSIQHRVKGVSNFEGTLIHELTHVLAAKTSLDKEWAQKFGWEQNQEKIEELQRIGLMDKLWTTPQKDWSSLHPDIWNLVRVWENDHPERCVTDYARRGPEDDLADSMVAAMRNPEILDEERFKFLRERFLKDVDEDNLPEVNAVKV